MEYLKSLYHYLLITSPPLLLGILVAGFFHQLVNAQTLKKKLGDSKFYSVFIAALWGIPMPICSCAVIPMSVSLRKSGAGNGATSSFLISTPESGVDSILMTYAMMDFPMTIIRPFFSLMTAILAGMAQIFNNFNLKEDRDESCQKIDNKKKESKIKSAINYGFGDLIDDISFWLVVGLLMGSFIDYFFSPNIFANFNGLSGKLLILLIGIPFYICASASTPIAASLVLKGMSPGTALIFLLVGPATNISNILVMQKYIGKLGVFINIAVISVVSFGGSYLVDFIYSYLSLTIDFKVANHVNDKGYYIIQVVSSIILVILLIKGVYKSKIKKWL